MNDNIKKGSIVLYDGCWYTVKAAFKDTVNLGNVFGSKTTIKGVSKSEVKEDYDAWYAKWRTSDTYKSM
jgi:hypothetical protein